MRFIRQEKLITTICNQEVNDEKIVIRVLNNLLKERVEFSLSINKFFQSDYGNRILSYDKAKVKKVNENSVDFFVFTGKSATVIPNISFDDVAEIHAVTTKHDILKLDPEANRFDLMDIEEDGIL